LRPSATTTAPIGTSPSPAARRASASASAMNVSSIDSKERARGVARVEARRNVASATLARDQVQQLLDQERLLQRGLDLRRQGLGRLAGDADHRHAGQLWI